MSFFQNPFDTEFMGSLLIAERHLGLTFKCRGNSGRGKERVVSWGKKDTYDLSGNDLDGNPSSDLSLNIAKFDANNTYKNWATITVDITAGAASVSAVTPDEIVTALNNNSNFSAYFKAELYSSAGYRNIAINMVTPTTDFVFYVLNGNAEEKLLFNKFAGVAELPTFFMRHTIENRFVYEDSINMLIYLDPSLAVLAAVIDNAVDGKGKSLGYSSSSVKEDYEIVGGRSSAFIFKKQTVDGSDRLTEVIEYAAGGSVGSLAKKTKYVYSGANTTPDQITEEPYVLQIGDLVTP